MLKTEIKRAVAILLVAFSAASSSFSATQIPQGVRFYISERGLGYYRTHFESLLKKHDIDLSKMNIEKIETELKNPFNQENLPKSVREKQGDLVKRLTSNFSFYFSGLNMGDPNFKLTLEELAYELRFQSFSVDLDPRGPGAYGLKRGVVALLRGEASEFALALPRLRAIDTKNPRFLGTIGADRFKAKLLDGDIRPARMEIPVVIDTNAQGLTVKVLAVRTNFTKVRFQGGFSGLVLPTMDIIINGNRYSFDRKAFETDVRKNLPEIMQLVQGGMKSYFEKDGGREIFQPQLDQVTRLANIGFAMPLDDKTRPERVELKVQPTKVSLDSRNFMLEFLASMVDPLFARGAGVFPTPGSAGVPALRSVPKNGYDVAIAVHPGIINGFVNRLFAYRFLHRMKINDKDEVTMTAAPVFTFSGADPKRAILHIKMETDADSIAVRSMVPIEFDMRVRLVPGANNEIDIIPEEILMDTVEVDRDKLRTWLFGALKSLVEKRVRAKLMKTNEDYRTKPSVMRSIPTLDEVMGIPLRLVDVSTDNGNIVIYSKYDQQ